MAGCGTIPLVHVAKMLVMRWRLVQSLPCFALFGSNNDAKLVLSLSKLPGCYYFLLIQLYFNMSIVQFSLPGV